MRTLFAIYRNNTVVQFAYEHSYTIETRFNEVTNFNRYVISKLPVYNGIYK